MGEYTQVFRTSDRDGFSKNQMPAALLKLLVHENVENPQKGHEIGTTLFRFQLFSTLVCPSQLDNTFHAKNQTTKVTERWMIGLFIFLPRPTQTKANREQLF